MFNSLTVKKIKDFFSSVVVKGIDHRNFPIEDRLKIEFVYRTNQGVLFQVFIGFLIFRVVRVLSQEPALYLSFFCNRFV